MNHYARCEECGAEPGAECMGIDNKPATDVCDGRVLVINDSAQRTRNPGSRRDVVVPDAVRRARGHRSHIAPIVMAPCDYCGAATRLWGAANVTGKTWCVDPKCQAAKKRAQWARDRASARARRLASPRVDRQCGCCGADFVACQPTQLYCTRKCSSRAAHRRERST